MAISVIHNPSDNKLCGLLQVFARRFTQCGALGFRSTANFSRFFSSLLLSLLQQLPAVFGRVNTHLL